MDKHTPTQRVVRIHILSSLLEGPMRFSKLWKTVKPYAKSKTTFTKALDALVNDRIAAKKEENPRHVIYEITEKARTLSKEELDLAWRISPWGDIGLILDCMEFLYDSGIFSSKENSTKAAIDFWVTRYRSLCELNALFVLLSMEEKNEVSAVQLLKLYKRTEEKLLDVIVRFQKVHPDDVQRVLRKHLSGKQIELKPSSISIGLDQFLRSYYPDAHSKLKDHEKAKIYFKLLERQKEKEYLHCEKFRIREMPKWVCRSCKYYKPDFRSKPRCRYQTCRKS